jgi:hypothetical protein
LIEPGPFSFSVPEAAVQGVRVRISSVPFPSLLAFLDMSSAGLGCDLFERKMRYLSVVASVLNRNRDDLSVTINIEQGVFIQVPGFGYYRRAELNI